MTFWKLLKSSVQEIDEEIWKPYIDMDDVFNPAATEKFTNL